MDAGFDDDDDFDEVMLQGLQEVELQQQEQTSSMNGQSNVSQRAGMCMVIV